MDSQSLISTCVTLPMIFHTSALFLTHSIISHYVFELLLVNKTDNHEFEQLINEREDDGP